ncbi:aryl-sulfate sulfotransferase [Polluticoccus soli]|uniref:aryl-sulfate sulfotransferase n=1 Tax=Polluticoccus soli TaxID=3034150 RepID=UPI0023E09FFE|nr:aryl-sulfate sulfotransferase [Flavipsychrobacter sp. JY13-12]
MRIILLIFLLLLHSLGVYAQVTPGENDTVNYKLVGFSVPADTKADRYLFEFAKGSFTEERAFAKNIAIKKNSSANKTIQLLPAFGETYTWRVSYFKKGLLLKHTELYHFRTGYIPFIDTTKCRVSVIKNTMPDKHLLIFYDNTRTLRDMKGDPVWYIPNIPGITDSSTTVRDLKLTPQGTITFLTASNGYEINYNGKILWSCPNDGQVSRDTSEFYHHEFTRLANGHYMIAGNEYVEREIPNLTDTARYKISPQITQKDGKYFQRAEFGTLIEYDAAKHAVWSWRSSEHLSENDFSRKNPARRTNYSSHMNSFYFDTNRDFIYVSFRNINSILKISYPQGDVIANYGSSSAAGEKKQGNGFFYGQHNVTKDSDGNLLLYNNNIAPNMRGYSNSSIELLKEPADLDNADTLKKIWEFSCQIDTLALPYSTSGGSVNELADGHFLTSMGSVNRVFIVNKRKEIIWDALCQFRDLTTEKREWNPQPGYRVSAIDSDEKLTNLIFK